MSEKTVIVLGHDLEHLRRLNVLMSQVLPDIYFYANDFKSDGVPELYALYANQLLTEEVRATCYKLAQAIAEATAMPSRYPRRMPEFITISNARRAFSEWLETYYDVYEGKGPTTADVDHSTLLHRLMMGGKKLPVPAPTFHSYPCYSIGEGKSYKPHEVYDYTGHPGKVVIDQNGQFTKLDNQTVRYAAGGRSLCVAGPYGRAISF
jgi:hypothetical protein